MSTPNPSAASSGNTIIIGSGLDPEALAKRTGADTSQPALSSEAGPPKSEDADNSAPLAIPEELSPSEVKQGQHLAGSADARELSPTTTDEPLIVAWARLPPFPSAYSSESRPLPSFDDTLPQLGLTPSASSLELWPSTRPLPSFDETLAQLELIEPETLPALRAKTVDPSGVGSSPLSSLAELSSELDPLTERSSAKAGPAEPCLAKSAAPDPLAENPPNTAEPTVIAPSLGYVREGVQLIRETASMPSAPKEERAPAPAFRFPLRGLPPISAGLLLAGGLLMGGVIGHQLPVMASHSRLMGASGVRDQPRGELAPPTMLAFSAAPTGWGHLPASAPTTTQDSSPEPSARRSSSQAPGDSSISNVMALARATQAARSQDLQAFSLRLTRTPPDVSDEATWQTLREYIYDKATCLDALELAARIPSPTGPDFLYHIWSSSARRTPVTELVGSLLSTRDLRDHASPELAVALALLQDQSCEVVLTLLDRVIQYGDQRSLPPLRRFLLKTGCGPSGHDDCYPCLREGTRLRRALQAAQRRPTPRLP